MLRVFYYFLIDCCVDNFFTVCCYGYRGVGAMELVAMDMKLRGQYIARQLSFKGVSFKIEEVKLSSESQKLYDDSVKLVSGKYTSTVVSLG